jgi:hypothetical protein
MGIYVLVWMNITPQTCQQLLSSRRLINLVSSCLGRTRRTSIQHTAVCFVPDTRITTVKLDNRFVITVTVEPRYNDPWHHLHVM